MLICGLPSSTQIARIAFTSSGLLVKEAKIKSTSLRQPKRISASSLADKNGILSLTPGTLQPLRELIGPATSTRHFNS